MAMIVKAAGFDDGDEAPANLGFFLLGEFDRDDARRKLTVEQCPKTFPDAGGIHDDVRGMPGFGEVF